MIDVQQVEIWKGRRMKISPTQVTTARAFLNWTLADLGDAAGIHWETVFNFESGKYEPSPEVAAMIREALEQEGCEFLEGSVEPAVRRGKITVVTG